MRKAVASKWKKKSMHDGGNRVRFLHRAWKKNASTKKKKNALCMIAIGTTTFEKSIFPVKTNYLMHWNCIAKRSIRNGEDCVKVFLRKKHFETLQNATWYFMQKHRLNFSFATLTHSTASRWIWWKCRNNNNLFFFSFLLHLFGFSSGACGWEQR